MVYRAYLDPAGIVAVLVTEVDGTRLYVEAITEMIDNTFLETSAIAPSPEIPGELRVLGIDHKRLWGSPAIEKLLTVHFERLESIAIASGSATCPRIRDDLTDPLAQA